MSVLFHKYIFINYLTIINKIKNILEFTYIELKSCNKLL